jgi:hypothetical protein
MRRLMDGLPESTVWRVWERRRMMGVLGSLHSWLRWKLRFGEVLAQEVASWLAGRARRLDGTPILARELKLTGADSAPVWTRREPEKSLRKRVASACQELEELASFECSVALADLRRAIPDSP